MSSQAHRQELCGVKILAICGSLRSASFNKQLLNNAAEMIRAQGGEVEFFDLKKNPLPFYDQDLEESNGLKFDNVGLIREKMQEADGVLLGVSEYNGSVSAALKNAIDWTSRPPNQWENKVVAMVGGAPGIYSTVRAQMHLRVVLSGVSSRLLPQGATIPFVHKAVNDGKITDESARTAIEAVAKALVKAARDERLVKYVHRNPQQFLGFAFHDGSLRESLD